MLDEGAPSYGGWRENWRSRCRQATTTILPTSPRYGSRGSSAGRSGTRTALCAIRAADVPDTGRTTPDLLREGAALARPARRGRAPPAHRAHGMCGCHRGGAVEEIAATGNLVLTATFWTS